ncbi:uncharacterized protein LODBEIA_P29270 [Lodderomyces beijingensis]|uniref:Glutaredoxin domain-containing protein n=1 Tax=Lodderomyces beijingensis TaxID=1775926 RepID=A0ABP0ZM37_9ASCO
MSEAHKKVENLIKEKPVLIVGMTWCPHCAEAERTIGKVTKDAYEVDMDNEADGDDIHQAATEITGQKTFPYVWISGKFIGGADAVQKLQNDGKLKDLVDSAFR